MAPKKAPLGTTPRRPGEADRDAIETQLLQLVSPHSRVLVIGRDTWPLSRTLSGVGCRVSVVEGPVKKELVQQGLLTLFVQHTSCSLLVQENADPDVQRDLEEFFQRLVPPGDHPSMSWLAHDSEGQVECGWLCDQHQGCLVV
jgi:hypothetical protein